MHTTATKSPFSIKAIAVVMLIGSLMVVSWSVWLFKYTYQHFGPWHQVLLYLAVLANAIFFVLNLFQIIFGSLGVITAIGLLLLREWARRSAVFLATAPILIAFCGVVLFLGANGNGGRAIIAAYGVIVYGAAFVILIPVSIWWHIVLQRDTTRSRFQANAKWG